MKRAEKKTLKEKLDAAAAKRRAARLAPPVPAAPELGESETALFYAVNQRDDDAVKRVLHIADTLAEKFARAVAKDAPLPDLAARDKQGFTVLHYAAMGGDVVILKLLVDAGADMHALTDAPMTVLGLAAINGKKDAVDFFLSRGFDINDKRYPEHANALCHALSQGKTDVALHLLEKGADPRAFGREGANGLTAAAAAGHVGVLEKILATGVLPDTKNKRGITALMDAVSHNQMAAAEFLLRHGACVDLQSDGDWTALAYAVRAGNADMTRLLIEHGADPFLQLAHKTHTAFSLAHNSSAGEKTLPVLQDHAKLRAAFLARKAEEDAKAAQEREDALRLIVDEASKGVRTTLSRKKPISFDDP